MISSLPKITKSVGEINCELTFLPMTNSIRFTIQKMIYPLPY